MKKSTVLFLHPDLGVGGAERLVVDAALALKNHGHAVEFLTTHHDSSHCFEETKDGSLRVTVAGDFLPRSVLGRCFALCATIRFIYATIYFLFFMSADIVFIDLLSSPVPILKLKSKVLYYCHFPDQLLSRKEGYIKSLYRFPLDFVERITTGAADRILVNSLFTLDVFRHTFPSISTTPIVVHPSINTKFFKKVVPEPVKGPQTGDFLFLSINRYERKKNIELALEALARLQRLVSDSTFAKVRLIIAGGYDPRVEENISYHEDLVESAKSLGVDERTIFLRSPSDREKVWLLRRADAVLYTPPNEHFGIVPLEAMFHGKPVVALNSGGPRETVLDGQNGFLCENDFGSFAEAMANLLENPDLCTSMGEEGKRRFEEKFSFSAFSKQLQQIVTTL